jgi:hypothetical protein
MDDGQIVPPYQRRTLAVRRFALKFGQLSCLELLCGSMPVVEIFADFARGAVPKMVNRIPRIILQKLVCCGPFVEILQTLFGHFALVDIVGRFLSFVAVRSRIRFLPGFFIISLFVIGLS